jgi:hypothetical protein
MTNNQELHALKMPQIIIKDDIPFVKWITDVDEMNKETLDSMYKVQSEIYNLFKFCELREVTANTINPAQQNVFMPLKVWNVNLGNCFAEISIHQRCLDGCFAEMKIL